MKTRPLPTHAGYRFAARLTGAKPRMLAWLAVGAWLLAGVPVVSAASGTWTNDAASVWSATTNWLSGTVADGADATADFSTINITANRTVTLDTSRTLGNASFADTNGAQSWLVNATGGSVLTLATSSGTPTLTTATNGANSNIVLITAPLAGTGGLSKAGNGVLTLGGTNSFTGATTINGGVLQLTNIATTNVATFPITPAPVLYLSFDAVSNNTVINQGSGGAAMNGSLVGTASIGAGLGQYGNALSLTAGAATGGSVLVNNAVAQLHGSATGNWTVGMWLKSKTPGGAYFYSGAGGWVSGNTKFFLIQNVFNNDGNGAHAGGVSNSRSWEAGTATVADGNWHFVVMTCNSGVISQYVDGVVDPLVYNQWTVNSVNASTQVRVGGVPTATDGEIGLNGFVDEFYMFTNGLSQVQVQTLMNFSSLSNGWQQSLPLPPTTAVAVAAPATLDLNGLSSAITGLSGAGLVTTKTTVGNPTLVISNAVNTTFSGAITNVGGIFSVLKLGSGSLTLAGTNSYTGLTTLNGGTLNLSGLSLNTNATIVNGGTLNISGSVQPLTTAAPSSYMVVGNGRVNFSGAFLTNYNFNIGSTTNGQGAFYQTAGLVKESQGANGAAFQLGSAQGGYGYYYIGTGASLVTGEIGVGGEVQPSGNGLMEVNGGAVIDTGYLVISRNGTGNNSLVPQTGILNVYSGSLGYSTVNGLGINCNWGAAGTAIINILGGVVTNGVATGFNLNNSANAGNTGILNLNGGLAQAFAVVGGANGTRVNFNGGTLQSSAANASFMTGLGSANIYGGGGTINNNGFAITIGQQFLAPAGNGVTSITGFTGGAGYIAPPLVSVVSGDGNGIGATAIAQIDASTGGATSGQVTNVILTCPGVNYTTTPTFTLAGGGATTPATITGAAPTANVSGGLTFIGTNVTTLNGGYTYTGNTLVSGGTLVLTAATVAPSVAGNMTVSNAALTVNSAGGTVSLPVGALAFLTNVTLNIPYGTVAVNPAVAAINASGSFTATATNITVNITGFGLQAGQFPLVQYTGTPLASLANFVLGPLPPGVTANLSNNVANLSIDLVITGTGQNLAWYGLLPDGVNVSTNWDITLTTNWVAVGTTTPALRYQEYTSGGATVGDPVVLDDTLYNDSVNPQATNLNLTTAVRPFQFLVNSSLPYSISGAGSLVGLGSLVKSNTGSLTLLTSNNFSGGTLISGGSLIITNDTALGTNNGLVTLNGSSLQVNGSTTNNARRFTIATAASIGVAPSVTARFGGSINGAASLSKVDNGTLVFAGIVTNTGNLFVKAGGLILDSGAAVTNTTWISIGQDGSDTGTLTMKGTAALFTSFDFNVADVGNATGTLNLQDTAILTANSLFVSSANAASSAAFGTVNQSGGTVNQTNAAIGTFVIGGRNAASALGVGVYNLSGGTVNVGAGGVRLGAYGSGTVNQSGGTFNGGIGGINLQRFATGAGTYNLNGGTNITFNITSSTSTSADYNFNGGTLKPFTNNAGFFQALTHAYVRDGGAIVDSSGFDITIVQPLLQSTNVSDLGLVGGLTKKGLGTLTLSGVNTFTGPLTNNAGTLVLNSASTYAGSAVVNGGSLSLSTASKILGHVTVSNSAVFSLSQVTTNTSSISNLTLGLTTGNGATLSLALASGNTATPFLSCQTLTLNASNNLVLAGRFTVGTFPLLKYVGAIAGSGSLTNITLPQGVVGYVSNSVPNTTIYAVITSTGPGLVWTGFNPNPALTNLWDLNSTTNWTIGGNPTTYQETVPPGDAVTFNDLGSGTVILSNTASPFSVVISNTATAYTFQDKGHISGGTSLVKYGTNAVFMNLTNNNYTGDTIISNGFVQLGSASAISAVANLFVGAGATLELNGFSQTTPKLTGAGIIDNNSANNVVLATGSGGGGTWNGTIQDQNLGGGVALTKTGNNTLLLGGTNYLSNPAASQVNGGAAILTNSALVSLSQAEFWVAQGAGSTGVVTVAGGTLEVLNNWLVVGRASATANGTLIVNSGTVQKAGGNGNIVVGSLGANGTLIVNGGQVLNSSMLWLGEGSTANAALYLNGGLIQAAQVRGNNNGGLPATSVAYFNGGTLQANAASASFIESGSMVMSNGLVLDDAGFTLSIGGSALQDGDSLGGGLIKKGSGTVYLDAANTYTGTTLVTNGTLAGIGSLSGPVVVAPAGTLGAGQAGLTVGTLTANSSLLIQGQARLRINKDGGNPTSDLITGLATASYGGTLTISNVTADATPLTAGDTFTLFSAATHVGNFNNLVGSPGSGLGYTFTNGILSVVAVVTVNTNATNLVANVNGNHLELSWPADHTGWRLQAQTNALTTGLNTNWVEVAGSATVNSVTNTINPANGAVFYRLVYP